MSITTPIAPENVLGTLGRHMLVDGYHVVMDLDRSHGSFIHDSLHGVEVLDLFSHFATVPIGYNHPKLKEPAFLSELQRAAVTKPANSDIYTQEMARFVETFSRVAVPPSHAAHLFFVEGGAVGVENALKAAFDWKVRKNFRKGYRREVGHQIIHFEQAFHGRTGYTLSLTNTADPRKTMYFPKFPWPRIVNPKLRFPVDEAELERVKKVEALALAQVKQALVENRDDVAALIIEPIQAEGGDNHFRPEFLSALRQLCDDAEMLLIFDEVQTGIGLTGRMWGFQNYGVDPDLFSFGKKMQVCGFAANDRIFDEPENVFTVSSRINSTWGRQPRRHGPGLPVPRNHRGGVSRRERPRRRRVPDGKAPGARARVPREDGERPREGPLHRVRPPRRSHPRQGPLHLAPEAQRHGPGVGRERHPSPSGADARQGRSAPRRPAPPRHAHRSPRLTRARGAR